MQRTLKEPSGVLLGTLWLYLYSMPVCDDKLVSVVIVSMTAFELSLNYLLLIAYMLKKYLSYKKKIRFNLKVF